MVKAPTPPSNASRVGTCHESDESILHHLIPFIHSNIILFLHPISKMASSIQVIPPIFCVHFSAPHVWHMHPSSHLLWFNHQIIFCEVYKLRSNAPNSITVISFVVNSNIFLSITFSDIVNLCSFLFQTYRAYRTQ